MINILLFCYLPSYLALLPHILPAHKALYTLSGRLSLHNNSRSSKRNVSSRLPCYLATLLFCYSDISLTPNGHSTQRLKLRILIKARLQTAPNYWESNPRSIAFRPIIILSRSAYAFVTRRSAQATDQTTALLQKLRTVIRCSGTCERGRGVFRSTFLVNERVLEPPPS